MNWWRHVIAAEFRKILAFRTDFWVTFIGQTFIQLFIARALWQSIFEASGNEVMEGYTLPMMTLYYIIIPVTNRMLNGENMGFISREIYDGTFTRYLIYPLSFFNYKTLTYLTYSAFYGIQLLLIFVIYHYYQFGEVTSAALSNLLIGYVLIMFASLTYANLSMAIELISLWADNVWALSVILKFVCFFLGGSFIPLVFFPEWLQSILAYTPFPYMISLPARTVMGLTTASEILSCIGYLIVWAVSFRFIASLVWKKGQHRYTGVGI